MSINNKSVVDPTLYSLIQELKADIFKNLNAVKIGSIQSFDTTTRMATVQIAFKRILNNGDILSIPVLLDCPVFTLQGGGAAFQAPIEIGDECIVLFADANIDAWYANGGQSAPADGRQHDLSDGIVLVGLNPLARPLLTFLEDDEAGLADADAKVAIKMGKVAITNQVQDLLTILTTLLTAQQALYLALSTDPGLQSSTQTAAAAAATAATNATTALAALFYTPI